MDKDEALKLLRGGPDGIEQWNMSRRSGVSGTVYIHCDLARIDLSNAVLTTVNLHDTDLSEATLVNAKLDYADLTMSKFANADLTRACLHSAARVLSDFGPLFCGLRGVGNHEVLGGQLGLATRSNRRK